MVAYESIKQGKVQLSNPKSGPGRLKERSLTRLLLQSLVTVQTRFHKGGCNLSWSLTRVVAGRALMVSGTAGSKDREIEGSRDRSLEITGGLTIPRKKNDYVLHVKRSITSQNPADK